MVTVLSFLSLLLAYYDVSSLQHFLSYLWFVQSSTLGHLRRELRYKVRSSPSTLNGYKKLTQRVQSSSEAGVVLIGSVTQDFFIDDRKLIEEN